MEDFVCVQLSGRHGAGQEDDLKQSKLRQADADSTRSAAESIAAIEGKAFAEVIVAVVKSFVGATAVVGRKSVELNVEEMVTTSAEVIVAAQETRFAEAMMSAHHTTAVEATVLALASSWSDSVSNGSEEQTRSYYAPASEVANTLVVDCSD